MVSARLRAIWASLVTACSTETGSRYTNGLVAVVLFVLTQLLICGVQHGTKPLNDFPAPIVAMLLVAVGMITLSWGFKGVDEFHRRYLRGPTDLLNKHMSVGFTVPFVTILSGQATQPRDVGIIMVGFIVTGILNSAIVYFAAQGLQTAITIRDRRDDSPVEDEKHTPGRSTPGIRIENPSELQNPSPSYVWRKCRSQASTLSNAPSLPYLSDNEGDTLRTATPTPTPHTTPSTPLTPSIIESAPASKHHAFITFIRHNPIFTLTTLLTPTLALPLALTLGLTTPLDTLLLALLWTGTLAAQHTFKHLPSLTHHPKTHTLLTTTLNPVLWTSLGMIGYIATKSHVTHTSPTTTLSAFTTNTTFADLLHGNTTAPGAGDIAISILNAGLVAWGLKLFECRAQLLSKAGLTILVVSCAAATLNVVCGPLLLRAMGLGRRMSLAFAARSVTLSLAGPAMKTLDGDVGLNAAMVVFSGILFQMGMGFGVVGWADRSWRRWKGVEGQVGDVESGIRRGSGRGRAGSERGEEGQPASEGSGRALRDAEDCAYDQPRTVATGVAVGINAAAMGTAYLYENHGRVAPYAALSMTVFGVMTVGLTSIPPLTKWLVEQVQ